MGGLQAPQAVKHPEAPKKVVPTFVNMEQVLGFTSIDPYDRIDDITHRELVNIYVHAQCPAAKEVTLKSERIDAAVSAESFEAFIFSVGNVTELPLTRNNLARYRTQVAAWLRPPEKKNGKYDPKELKAYKLKQKQRGIPDDFPAYFRRLEEMNQRGIPVFQSAGNTMSSSVNLLSFANGVTSVGALDKNGKKTDYSSDNSLVTRWEQGNYPIKQIFGKKGDILGYNVTGGQQVEIPLSKTTGRPPSGKLLLSNNLKTSLTPTETPQPIVVGEKLGTSFAAPTAVGKFLRQKYGKGCDLN